ncbi:MAG: class I SAM-dependent methyltransferase [Anaerolineae bacterium]|nr:class I SAM-dependent methyltransferase [Anaerolineae bacterium]
MNVKRIPESQAIAQMTDARQFSEVMGNNRIRQAGYRQLARQAVDLGVPEGGMVLDMGTGPGYVAIELAKLLAGSGSRVIGMDLSEAMLALAAENAAKARVADIVSWRQGDARAMPFQDGEIDLIVSNDSLHHWTDPLPVFDEIARVLKADGRCVVHDSKRLQRRWPWLFVKTVSLSIPRDFRVHWWNSIKSSYTSDELRAILERSRLKNWRIEEEFLDLRVVKA